MKRNPFILNDFCKMYMKVLLSSVISIIFLSGYDTSAIPSGPLLFDMGTDTSAVWKGFTKVTVSSIFTPSSGFGWQSEKGLSGQARYYGGVISKNSDGTMNVPQIWTNPVTEDAVVGDQENLFLFQAPPGNYKLYIVCGISESRSNQFWDFTVKAGKEQKRVQFEGGQQFRALRFNVRKGRDPISVKFSPLNKWVVNAILAWSESDNEYVQKEIINPFEEWTYRMPPEEWAKWKPEPLPPAEKPRPDPADTKRGFIVFTRPWQEPVYPQTTPRPEDLNPSLKIFATPGEYEPVNFIVYPLKNLSKAEVTVSDIGPVPAKNIDIRYARFMRARPNYTTMYRYLVVPDPLEHFSSLDLIAGENTRFWLTVHIPENAPAGTYNGKITFTCSEGKVVVPVSIQILPFKLLDDPGKIFGIYYRNPLDRMSGADEVTQRYFRRKADLEHADMVAHGTRNTTMSCGGGAADASGNFDFNWDLMAEKFALRDKYGFRGPVVMSIPTAAVYRKYMNDSYGSHLANLKTPPEEFSRELTAMVRVIEAERRKRGWPEFLYYPVDEPSRDDVGVNFMITVLKACRAAGVRTYVTAGPTIPAFQPLRPYVDVWCTQPYTPDRETILSDMKASKNEYWCYPNHVAGENDHTPVSGARMTYGFGFWRSGFLALTPWIYSASSGDPYNYLDGRQMDFFNRFEPDGSPVPVTLWEGYREGYDDYRYIYTLEQAIAEAKKSRDIAVQEKVAAAETELRNVWDAINVQAKYKYDGLWAPAEFDKYRWQIARQIIDIQEILKGFDLIAR
jgi:hypothetical protein